MTTGQRYVALFLCHAANLLRHGDLARDELPALAGTLDGELVAVCVDHATAAARRSGAAYAATSERYEGLGMLLAAAECAQRAASLFEPESRRRSSIASTRAASCSHGARACPRTSAPWATRRN